MLTLPTLGEMGLTRDDVTAQSFGFTKQELYEGALECVRRRVSDLIDAELAEAINTYEMIFGDFAWDQDFAEIMREAFPALPGGALNENIFGQKITDPAHRATVAYDLAAGMLGDYRAPPSDEGKFLAACGVTAQEWEGAEAPVLTPEPSFAPAAHLVGEAPPAPLPPPPPILPAPPAAVVPAAAPAALPPPPPPPAPTGAAVEGSGEALASVLKQFAAVIALDKASFAKGLAVSEGTVNNYLTGRNSPKKFTPEQRAFMIAEVDGRIAMLRQIATALEG